MANSKDSGGDVLNFLGPLKSVAIKKFSKMAREKNVRSLILVLKDNTGLPADSIDNFQCAFFKNDIQEELKGAEAELLQLRAANELLRKRNNFLEDFRNAQLGLPTRAQQLKEGI